MEGGEDVGATPAAATAGGRDRVSATTFAAPATCRMSLVYSAIYANCRCCFAVQGSVLLARAAVRGL